MEKEKKKSQGRNKEIEKRKEFCYIAQ